MYCRLRQCHVSAWLAVKLAIVQTPRQMDMIAHILLSPCNIYIRTVISVVCCPQVKTFSCDVQRYLLVCRLLTLKVVIMVLMLKDIN